MLPVTDVVFDVGGVLVEWHPRLALRSMVPADRMAELVADDDRHGFWYAEDLRERGMTAAEVLPRYEAEQGPEYAALYRLFNEHWEEALTGAVPGMADLLADLAPQGVRLWALTNWAADRFPTVRARFPELFTRLSGVLVSGEEHMAKPDPEFYALALTRFRLDSAHTLFLDDLQYNVDAANAAGLPAVRFAGADQARAVLRVRGLDL